MIRLFFKALWPPPEVPKRSFPKGIIIAKSLIVIFICLTALFLRHHVDWGEFLTGVLSAVFAEMIVRLI